MSQDPRPLVVHLLHRFDTGGLENGVVNVINHLLSLVPYEDLTPEPIILPPREPDRGYVRPPMDEQTFIPEVY